MRVCVLIVTVVQNLLAFFHGVVVREVRDFFFLREYEFFSEKLTEK